MVCLGLRHRVELSFGDGTSVAAESVAAMECLTAQQSTGGLPSHKEENY
jgi:hypothetical protein